MVPFLKFHQNITLMCINLFKIFIIEIRAHAFIVIFFPSVVSLWEIHHWWKSFSVCASLSLFIYIKLLFALFYNCVLITNRIIVFRRARIRRERWDNQDDDWPYYSTNWNPLFDWSTKSSGLFVNTFPLFSTKWA